ncbi:MAG: hypothetical protein LBN29_01230 [Mediterranea sp.]|jgi:hypothetical protein|nr:hypothetical protein [Mediterranea sp.]
MKITTNKPVSQPQLKALHATFRRLGMDDDARHDCVHSFTGGRTSSTGELTFEEARQLLSKLNPRQTDEEVREMLRKEALTLCRRVYSLSMKVSFLNKGFSSETEDDKRMNIAKINAWARTHTSARKNISQMTVNELRETKKQLEAIARKEKND